jgi:hypothetical protein
VTNDTVKVDLYKIDYTQRETAQTKCSSLTADKKLYEDCVSSVNSGNIAVELVHSYEFTGGYSSSPALNNPRMFVWNAAKKLILLPLFSYDEKYIPTFGGLKGLHIPLGGEMKEVISQNYFSSKNERYQSYDFDSARVGYLGEVNYYLWKGFVAFSQGNDTRVKLGEE